MSKIHGIGIDVVEVERFKASMERFGPRLLERVFTGREVEYCLGKRHPERHLAARFAAKVSVMKAAGRPLRFRDVEVLSGDTGRPGVRVKGLQGLRFEVSITHDAALGAAEAIAEKE